MTTRHAVPLLQAYLHLERAAAILDAAGDEDDCDAVREALGRVRDKLGADDRAYLDARDAPGRRRG